MLYFRGYIPDIPRFRTAGVDATISINDRPTEVVNLKAGKFTLTRLIKDSSDITSISLHFSDAQVYDTDKDKREVSAFVDEISINDVPDFASFRDVANQAGEKFVVTGIDADGWIAKSAEFKAPSFDGFKVLKLDLEMPGWAPIAVQRAQDLGRRPHDQDGHASRARPSRASTFRFPRGRSGSCTSTPPRSSRCRGTGGCARSP